MPKQFTSARFDLQVEPKVEEQPQTNRSTPGTSNYRKQPIPLDITAIVISDDDSDDYYKEPLSSVPKKRKVVPDMVPSLQVLHQDHDSKARRVQELADLKVSDKTDSSTIRAALKEKLKEANEYKERLEKSQAEISEQQNRMRTIVNSKAKLQKLLDKSRSDLESTKTQLEEVPGLKTQLEQKTHELEAASKDQKALKKIMESQTEQLQRSQKDMNELSSALEANRELSQERLCDLESRLEWEKQETIKTLHHVSLIQKDLTAAKEKTHELEQKVQQNEQSGLELKEALDTIKMKEKELSDANEAKESSIRERMELSKTVSAQSRELDALRKTVSVNKENLHKREVELKNAQETNKSKDKKMSDMRAELSTFETELHGVKDLAALKMVEVATLARALSQVKEESARNKTDAKKVKAAVEKKDQELALLKETVSDARERAALVDALEDQNATLRHQNEELKSTEPKLAISQHELQKQRHETNTYAGQKNELQEKASYLESNKRDIQNHIIILEEKVAAAEARSSRVEDLELQLQTTNQTIKQLQNHYDTCPIAQNQETWTKFIEAWNQMQENIKQDDEKLRAIME